MTPPVLRARAPAKVNLCLLVGPTRADGRHELVTVFDTVALHDELVLRPAHGDADEVACPGVEGENLAARALAAFREATGWDGPPVRLEIAKRIPVAGGMAGGSADAAAALRLVAAAAGAGDPALLERLAATLGADVPGQVRGGRLLARGAGERLAPAPPDRADPYGLLVLPVAAALPTPAVYARADALRPPRSRAQLDEAAARLRTTPVLDTPHAAENDLQDAAVDLCPPVAAALEEARRAGADHALASGSGPTVLGLFTGPDGPDRAARAAERLARRVPAALATVPVPPGFGAVEEVAAAPSPA